jgi:putative monooxygenase
LSDVSVITLTDVEPVQLAGGSWSRVLVADKTVGGNVSALGYSVFKPGTSTADLSHATEELAYIVSGSGVIRLETKDVPVAAGQALYVPAKLWHTVINPGGDDLVMVFSFPSPDYPPTDRREPRGELPSGTCAGHPRGRDPAGQAGLPDPRPVRPGGPHPGPRQRARARRAHRLDQAQGPGAARRAQERRHRHRA